MEKQTALIMIGSTGRNAGKTFLAAELIKRLREPVTALKVTGIERGAGLCPRGGQGCGACNIDGDFCLTEEFSGMGGKDTAMLLAAGASRAFWLRCLRPALESGFDVFRERYGGEGTVLCESNSLREVVEPAFFIMIYDSFGKIIKPSAEKVMGKSDFAMQNPISQADIDVIVKILSKKGFNFKETG
jgi:hypothetical protein